VGSFFPKTPRGHGADFKAGNTGVKALCLHVAHTCNLTCDYCFASQGKFHGERALMPFDVGKQAIDFLIAHSGARTNLEVDFFGGEPLLNWQVVKQIVAYAREREASCRKNFRFTLTTNGLLIDDGRDRLLQPGNAQRGAQSGRRREVHDRLRKTVGGKGSYDIVVPKFQSLSRCAETKIIIYAEPSPTTTRILQTTFFIWPTLALPSCPWTGGVRAGRPVCPDRGGSSRAAGAI
jgi:uncharacterized protein